MVTDQEIAQALETLLRESNPNQFTSINGVIQQLESKLGLDLSNKLDFIRAQIHQSLLLRSQQHHHHQQQQQQQHQQQHHSHQQQQHPHPRDHFALQQSPNFPTNPSPFPPQFQNYNPPPVVVPKAEPVAAVSAQSVAVAAPEASKEGVQAKPKRKGGPGGLNKLCGVSPELQAIVGHPALPRTEIVKQLWAYIRKNSLQDPSNKRKIICNDELRLVFETDCTDMFKMNKLLSKHIYALEPSKASTKKAKVAKVAKVEPGTKSSESGPSVIISEALANFFGTGGREMPQSEVIRRVWEYIKVNHLEDPVNSMVIVCDGKLQELFGCESIPALGIPEMLARHHLFKKS